MELIIELSGLPKAITHTIRVRRRSNVKTVMLARNSLKFSCQGLKYAMITFGLGTRKCECNRSKQNR